MQKLLPRHMRPARSPDEIESGKAWCLHVIEAGGQLKTARLARGYSCAEVGRWRQRDAAFDQAMAAATLRRNAIYGDPRGRPPTPPDLTEFRKAELPEMIAVGGMPLTRAVLGLRIHWSFLARWRAEDAAFARLLSDAIAYGFEVELDRLLEMHEDFTDLKVAALASRNLKTWLGWRDPRSDEGGRHLAELLRDAEKRLRGQHKPTASSKRRKVFRFVRQPPSEGT
jgi:hypothetical protein